MSNNDLTTGKIRELIEACASLEPSALIASSLLTELEEVAKTVEPDDCDGIAEIFFEMCTGRDENGRSLPDRKEIESIQRVLILSIVEKMNFPESRQAEGFHYWADKCSVELMDIGGFFFEQDEPEELKLVLSLIESEKISEFAQPSLMKALYELHEDEMKRLLSSSSSYFVWLGAFANSEFTTKENIQWLIENIPDTDLIDLVNMIEESPVSSMIWEYPFLYFSREERITDSVVSYLIEILQSGYTFKNEKERTLAGQLLEWEEENDEFENFISLAVEVCDSDEEVLRMAQDSSLTSLVDAVTS